MEKSWIRDKYPGSATLPLTYELSLDLLVGLVHGSRPVQLVMEQPQVLARLIAELQNCIVSLVAQENIILWRIVS